MTRPPKSLSDRLAINKLRKRDRLDEALRKGRRGNGRHRRFQFSPLKFDSDGEAFERLGGARARQDIKLSHYRRRDGALVNCRELSAPSSFTCEPQDLEQVLRFVYELRRQALIERTFFNGPGTVPGYVNLSLIRRIDLPGALLLTAELDRIRRVVGFRPTLDDHNWSAELRATLKALGVYDIIRARSSEMPGGDDGLMPGFGPERIKIIKMRSGQYSANREAEALRDELFDACAPFSTARPQIYNVLVEAFNNSREHAYPEGTGEDGLPSVRAWWAGALVDYSAGVFQLCVYDQGIGIPERFARQHRAALNLRVAAGGAGDLALLEMALSPGGSSTDEPGRGNGLWQMTELTRDLDGSSVQFTSLGAGIICRNGTIHSKFISPQRFGGTMVNWQVPFRLGS